MLLIILLSYTAYARDCKIDVNHISASAIEFHDHGGSSLLLLRTDKKSIGVLSKLDSNCKETILDKPGAIPISIFYFIDGRTIFGTLWGTGDGMLFRVYLTKTGRIIFNKYFKMPPSVFWLDDDGEYPVFYTYPLDKNDNDFGFILLAKMDYIRKQIKMKLKLYNKK